MSREENRNENRDESRGEKTSGSARLGKEAKIGVTVIAVLLTVLGVVAVMRFTGSSPTDKVDSVADREGGKEKFAHESKTEAMLKDTKSKLFGGGNPPTVVPAKVVSARPSRTTSSDLDQWKIASDRGDVKRAGGEGSSLSTPPSFMPDPPKPPRADRHERYALDPPSGRDVDNGRPFREANNDMRLVAPDDNGSYRENSRIGSSTPPQPPAPLRGNSHYSVREERSTPVTPAAQYKASEANDYHRESAGFRHNGNERRHSATASSYSPPPRRDDGKYEVQPNDSYWTISEKLYGTGAYFKALAQHNRGKGTSEDRLQPGELILAPPVAQLEQSYADLCPKPNHREAIQSQSQNRVSAVSARNQSRGGRMYTVVEGDTLFNIARYELGKASRWAEIYDLNRDVLGKDFNYLTPGIQLAMPEGEKSDMIAQPPSNVYRR